MTPSANHIDYSETWMLFESGNGVVVDLEFYAPPKKTTRPIDAWLVTGDEGVFKDSARRAALAVFDAVHPQQGLGSEPMVVGFDLEGLPGGRPVTGESGGLAFAMALAKRLLQKDPGPVAATGEVKSGHGGGPVGPVQGIEAKLQAAGRLVPENGWVLYPKENDPDIPEALRRSLTDKGLKLQPVSSVAEALGLLFDTPNSEMNGGSVEPGKPPPPVRRSLVLVLICSALLLLLQTQQWFPFAQKPTPDQVNPASPKTRITVIEREAAPKEKTGQAETKKTDTVEDEPTKEKVKENIEAKDDISKDDAAGGKIEKQNTSEDRRRKDKGEEIKTTNEAVSGNGTSEESVERKAPPEEERPEDPKTETEAGDNGSSTESGQALQLPTEITLSGQTAMASRLAQWTAQKLEDLFNQGPSGDTGPLRITGQVGISRIIERPGEKEDELTAEITVAARKVTFRDGPVTRSLPDIQVTTRGRGLATALLPAAGSTLADEILRAMKRKAPERAKPIQAPKIYEPSEEASGRETNRGFE